MNNIRQILRHNRTDANAATSGGQSLETKRRRGANGRRRTTRRENQQTQLPFIFGRWRAELRQIARIYDVYFRLPGTTTAATVEPLCKAMFSCNAPAPIVIRPGDAMLRTRRRVYYRSTPAPILSQSRPGSVVGIGYSGGGAPEDGTVQLRGWERCRLDYYHRRGTNSNGQARVPGVSISASVCRERRTVSLKYQTSSHEVPSESQSGFIPTIYEPVTPAAGFGQ